MENYIYIVLILAGVLAGFINTLAGSGSLITLSIFMNLGGLPADIANGTNRIGVLLQSITATSTFVKNDKIQISKVWKLLVPMVLGAVLGAVVASQTSAQNMEYAIGAVMFIMLVIILLKPKKWLRETSDPPQKMTIITLLSLFGVGFYGGFVQAGVGVLMLAVLVLQCGLTLTESNAIKLLAVLVFTLPILVIFIYEGQIDWIFGGVTAIGQVIGAQLASRFAVKSQAAGLWTRRLLILVVVVSILKLVLEKFYFGV